MMKFAKIALSCISSSFYSLLSQYLFQMEDRSNCQRRSYEQENDQNILNNKPDEYKQCWEFYNNLDQHTYQQQLKLILVMLSFYRNRFIVSPQKITKSDKKLEVAMQKGIKFNEKETGWFSKKFSKSQISAEEKLCLMSNISKALVQLQSISILYFDVKPQNIVKIKDSFKIIDFDHALYLGSTKLSLKHRNYLRQSQISKIRQKLQQNTYRLLKQQVRSIKGQIINYKQSKFITKLIEISCIKSKINSILLSQDSDQKKTKDILLILLNLLSAIHSIQFGQLLKTMFGQADIRQIQVYRRKLIPPEYGHLMKPLSLLIQQLVNGQITLTKFHSWVNFQYKTTSEILENDSSQAQRQKIDSQYYRYYLLNYIYEADRQVLTNERSYYQLEKQLEFTKFNRQNLKQFQTQNIKVSRGLIKDLIDEHKQENHINHIEKNIDFNRILKSYSPNITYSQLEQQSDQKNSGSQCSPIQYKINYQFNGGKLDLLWKAQKLSNIKDNYFAFQLFRYKYLIPIQSTYINKPIKMTFDQINQLLYTYYEKETTNSKPIQNIHHYIVQTQGLNGIIRCIKDICKLIIHLEQLGLFLSQIKFETIVRSNENSLNVLQADASKLFFLDFIKNEQMLSSLISITKIMVKYAISQQKYLIQQLPQLNNILSFFQILFQDYQKYNYEFGFFVIKKALCKDEFEEYQFSQFLYFLKQYFKKLSSLGLGKQIKSLLKMYQIQSKEILSEEQKVKLKHLSRLVQSLLAENIYERIQIKAFMQQVNRYFPTCQHINHQSSPFFYFFIQPNTDIRVQMCEYCIQEKINRNQIFCLVHNKPILYSRNKYPNLKFMRKYYCQTCYSCNKLQKNSIIFRWKNIFCFKQYLSVLGLLHDFNSLMKDQLRLVDKYDLEECQHICLQSNCTQPLISEKNRQQHHRSHSTFTLAQFALHYSKIKCKNLKNSNKRNDDISYGHASSRQIFLLKQHQLSIRKIFEIIEEYSIQNQPNYLSLAVKEDIFWKITKIANLIYNKQKKEQYKLICFQDYYQHACRLQKDLKIELRSKIEVLQAQVKQQFHDDIFCPDILQRLKNNLQKQYSVIKEPEIASKPCSSFEIIPSKYNLSVQELYINRQEVGMKKYFSDKISIKSTLYEYYHRKYDLYSVLIKMGKNQMLGPKINKQAFNISYNKYHKLIIDVIKEQALFLDDRIRLQVTSQQLQLNVRALKNKLQHLDMEKEQINIIISQLQSINESLKSKHHNQTNQQMYIFFQQQKNKFKQILINLNQLRTTIRLNLNFFQIQFMELPITFTQQQQLRMYQFSNLKKISINLNKNCTNRFLTKKLDYEIILNTQILQNLLRTCKKLNTIQVRGGYIDYYPCLQRVPDFRKGTDFVFYVDTANINKNQHHLKSLLQNLSIDSFKFPCVRLQLKVNISSQQKQSIMKILSLIEVLNLQIVGRLKISEQFIQILEYIIAKQKIKIISLNLIEFKIQKNKEILQKLSRKGVEKIQLKNCSNCNGWMIGQCCPGLKQISFYNSTPIVIESAFVSSIFCCPHLYSIKFTNIDFSSSQSLSLSRLKNLLNLNFSYCQQVSARLIKTLPLKALQNIQNCQIVRCSGIQTDFIQVLKKMSSLRSLSLIDVNMYLEGLLEMKTKRLQGIEFGWMPNITDKFLRKIDRKWPQIQYLTLTKCNNVTFQLLKCKQTFKKLKCLKINCKYLNEQEKHWLITDRKIHIQQY